MKNFYKILDENTIIDLIAKDHNFYKTTLHELLNIENNNEIIYFYINDKDNIYACKQPEKVKLFIKKINEVSENKNENKFIQIIPNNSKRRCIFNYYPKNNNYDDKNKLVEILLNQAKTESSWVENYIITDIIAENYDDYRKKCEMIFENLIKKHDINYENLKILNNKYDKSSEKFYSEFGINLKYDYEDIYNLLPINDKIINLNIENLTININSIIGNHNNNNSNVNSTGNNSVNLKNQAKEWLKNNCPNEFKLKDIVTEFKENNKNVKHTMHYIGSLLREMGFNKKHTNKGNIWKKS